MAFPYSQSLFFILSHLLIILHLVEGQDKPPHACIKEFECGKLGTLSFPFTNSSETCGLRVDCQGPKPRINLGGGEYWPFTVNHSQKQIQIEVTKDCGLFQNFTLPANEDISFTMSSKLTPLLKCYLSSSDSEISAQLSSYGKFSDCDGFEIYYNKSENTISDYTGIAPPHCLTIQLAVENRNLDLDNFYDSFANEISLEWSLTSSSGCSECSGRGKSKKVRLILGLAVCAGGIIMILAIIMYFVRGKNLSYCWETETDDYRSIENFLRNYGSVPKRFKYKEIKKITSSFKNKLGQGGFGSVFKGYLDGDKNPIAVKLLSISNGTGEEFVNEVASISNTSHVNVVKLLGFCFENNKRALVYEYMPNGSLEKFIFGGKSAADNQLGWPTLFKIAIGIARGLEYLHLFCTTRMVHFDIKPHNVLLDQEFCPKISDFGLAKLCSENRSMFSLSGARGTIGYIAPEVVCKNFGGVSHKSDVYSYGMMILEMVGGRKNSDVGCDDSSQIYFPHWIYAQLERNQEIVLPSIMNDEEKQSARKMIIVSLWCIQTDPSQRPTMSRVVEMLEGNLDMLQIPPRPYLFSSANSCVADSSSLH